MRGILPLVAACLAGASPLAAQTVAITNGTLVLGDGSDPIPGGTVVVRNGRIVAAGGGVRVPSNAEVIDANGKWVTPGIVAGFSRLGLAEVDLGADGSDDTETGNSPFSAYTRPDKVWIDGAMMYDADNPRIRPVTDFELGQPGEGDVK